MQNITQFMGSSISENASYPRSKVLDVQTIVISRHSHPQNKITLPSIFFSEVEQW